MEERLIETLRRLVTEHDVELAEMLRNSDKMAEERDRLLNSLLQNNNHSTESRNLDFGLRMVVRGMDSLRQSKRDSLNKLIELVQQNASYADLNSFLNTSLTSEIKNKLIIYLTKKFGQQAGITELSDEVVTAEIKISYDKKWTSSLNSHGPYQIELVINNEDVPLSFEYKLDKLIYMWFLLHPGQLMTKRGIWCPDDKMHNAFANEQLKKLAGLMFPENCKNPILEHTANSDLDKNWKYENFDKQFSGIKGRIHKMIDEKLNGRVDSVMFDIQEEEQTPGNKGSRKADNKPSRYLINLDEKDIKFSEFDIGHKHKDLTQCRMEEGKYDKV